MDLLKKQALKSFKLKNLFNTVLIHDLGSGLVIVSDQFLDKFNLDIFKTEMTVQSSIKKGSDLVMFSGDKLFGSIQSGSNRW